MNLSLISPADFLAAFALPKPPPRRAPAHPYRPAHAAHATLPARPVATRTDPPRAELRIDVAHPAGNIETELQTVHDRLLGAYLPQRVRCTVLSSPLPGFRWWHREADGEHYVYVEDVAARRLAGYTVFNRLIEVNRRLDRFVRAPHSKYAAAYQRRGLATAVYTWALGEGTCLISGARQSPGAHALWLALGRHHPLGYVELVGRRLRYMGTNIDPVLRERLNTRLMLLGTGWSIAKMHARL